MYLEFCVGTKHKDRPHPRNYLTFSCIKIPSNFCRMTTPRQTATKSAIILAVCLLIRSRVCVRYVAQQLAFVSRHASAKPPRFIGFMRQRRPGFKPTAISAAWFNQPIRYLLWQRVCRSRIVADPSTINLLLLTGVTVDTRVSNRIEIYGLGSQRSGAPRSVSYGSPSFQVIDIDQEAAVTLFACLQHKCPLPQTNGPPSPPDIQQQRAGVTHGV